MAENKERSQETFFPKESNDVTQDSKQPDVHPNNKLNELTSKEWVSETVSVWRQQGLGSNHPDTKIEKQHPAPFSFTDVRRLIRFFTKSGQLVLDPFLGVGSTLKACALEDRSGLGFELNPKYVELTKKRLRVELGGLFKSKYPQKVIEGDAGELVDELDDNVIDFVVTSPPYWNILHKSDHKVEQERIANGLDTKYSNNDKDLGNIEDYDKFLKKLSSILGRCSRVLKPEKYMAVIVSDFRNKSEYVMFHADLVDSLRPYNLEIRGITILYQPQKRVFPYGYPYAYVPNIHHQYILILQNAT